MSKIFQNMSEIFMNIVEPFCLRVEIEWNNCKENEQII